MENQTHLNAVGEITELLYNAKEDAIEDEVTELQLKIHGQFACIEYNEINEKFYKELKKEGIDIKAYHEAYKKLSDYYSEGYEEVKEESDNHFIKEVVTDMKRIMEIANRL